MKQSISMIVNVPPPPKKKKKYGAAGFVNKAVDML